MRHYLTLAVLIGLFVSPTVAFGQTGNGFSFIPNCGLGGLATVLGSAGGLMGLRFISRRR